MTTYDEIYDFEPTDEELAAIELENDFTDDFFNDFFE